MCACVQTGGRTTGQANFRSGALADATLAASNAAAKKRELEEWNDERRQNAERRRKRHIACKGKFPCPVQDCPKAKEGNEYKDKQSLVRHVKRCHAEPEAEAPADSAPEAEAAGSSS